MNVHQNQRFFALAGGALVLTVTRIPALAKSPTSLVPGAVSVERVTRYVVDVGLELAGGGNIHSSTHFDHVSREVGAQLAWLLSAYAIALNDEKLSEALEWLQGELTVDSVLQQAVPQ